MKQRLFVGLLGMFLLLPICGRAQSAEELGLVLNNLSTCTVGHAYDKDPELICQNIKLEFRNEGSSPIIIINPTLGFGSGLKQVIVYYTDFNLQTRKSKILSESKVTVSSNSRESANFEAMTRLFDGDSPPENFTITLQPKETFSFNDFVIVKVPIRTIKPERYYEVEDPDTGKLVKRLIPAEKLTPGCFRLVYEYSFLPYISDPDFLEHLNLKWKRFGRLPVGTNGTYTVTSDLFPCELA